MKNKILSLLFTIIILIQMPVSTFAVSDDVNKISSDIIKIQSDSYQSFIDGYLCENAGILSEWYVIAISQSGVCSDYSKYITALEKYISENIITNALARQRYALAFTALNHSNSITEEAADETIGKQGIMSWIFGLHLLNNGCKSSIYTVDSVIEKIISMQLSDGGWAVVGSLSDIDSTAMAIQSLAPYYKTKESVKNAVEKALVLLSSRQLDSGGYKSFGTENAESIAQVLTALSCLQIDCQEDERFIKNSHTLLDALSTYKTQSGAFAHTVNAEASDTATVQVYYSLVAYDRMKKKLTPLYVFDKETDNQKDVEYKKDIIEPKETVKNIKPVICISIAAIAIAVCVIFFVLKKRSYKNYLVVITIATVAITAVMLINISSVNDYYGTVEEKGNIIGAVTITIRCDKVRDNGIILDTTQFDISEDDTVFDILIDAAKKYKLHIEKKASATGEYISAIDYLYELQHGDLSGWVYKVNGENASVGCDKYKLADKDSIEWIYTVDYKS